ncbi:MAG: winged helix-turn-helix domain-containing protein [Arcticibacter sp.]
MSRTGADLSGSEARRIALTAQGFNSLSRQGELTPRQMRKVIEQLGLLQIDSVNVLVRAHYMPIFSRLGGYDSEVLDALLLKKPRRYFEYWGHEASILPIDCHPLLRWRMAEAEQGRGIWKQLVPYAGERRHEADGLLNRIRMEGPLAASDLTGKKASKGMWIWSDVKHALEWLFWSGKVAATHRRGSFERVYDLPERVLPQSVLQLPTPDEVAAKRMLLALAAKSLGIATADDLRDYYRLPGANISTALQELLEEGTISSVRVEGWKQQAYLYKDARAGRKLRGASLLSPFDPLVWHRPRTERLFGFRYRLEIYTPVHRREYGYYVLPFLLDGMLVARVDLKADRRNNTLLVLGIHTERDAPEHTFMCLMDELSVMASWLGLSEGVIVL